MTTLFISHASEDKDAFVRPLADALKKEFDVWYDDYELIVGRSLRQQIDDGLKKANFGVVVLSKSFFAKDWPQRELDGLLALETKNQKLILPVWYRVTKEEVTGFSPTLAGIVAARADKGLNGVVEDLTRAISFSNRTREVTTIDRGKAALQSLTKNLGAAEYERQRLDSYAGADEVASAVNLIIEKISEQLEAVNQTEGKKRFFVKKLQDNAISVVGPYGVVLHTALRNRYVNTAMRSEFVALFDQNRREFPDPPDSAGLSMLTFVPRIIDAGESQWMEASEKQVMQSAEVAGKIIEQFCTHIEEAKNQADQKRNDRD